MKKSQYNLLLFIARCINKNNESPTFEEIAIKFDMSRQNVHGRLLVLKKHGYVKVKPRIKRGLVIAKIPRQAIGNELRQFENAMEWHWQRCPPPSAFTGRGALTKRDARVLAHAKDKPPSGGDFND